jgi:hypothetical protein
VLPEHLELALDIYRRIETGRKCRKTQRSKNRLGSRPRQRSQITIDALPTDPLPNCCRSQSCPSRRDGDPIAHTGMSRDTYSSRSGRRRALSPGPHRSDRARGP